MPHKGPVLITDASVSYADQLAYRKRRYKLLMGLRIPLLVAAVVVFLVWQLPWVAVGLIILSIPLPWMAVLIANDRPAGAATRLGHPDRPRPRSLPADPHGDE